MEQPVFLASESPAQHFRRLKYVRDALARLERARICASSSGLTKKDAHKDFLTHKYADKGARHDAIYLRRTNSPVALFSMSIEAFAARPLVGRCSKPEC